MRAGTVTWRAATVALVVVAAGGALVKAAGLTTRYEEQLQRLRSEWRAAQVAQGLDPARGRKTLYDKYPTPEITLCKPVVIAPGASAAFTMGGRFTPQTTFLIDHDKVTLEPGAAAAGKYAATARVASDALPAVARLFAYAPVSGAWDRCGAVVVGAMPTMSLTASNGWTITLSPAARAWTVTDSGASIAYKAEYFEAGATAPFETMTGALTVSADSAPRTELTFDMQPGLAPNSAAAEYQALAAKMSDPQAFMRMSPREQAAFQKKLEEIGDRMTKEMESMAANVEAFQAKQAEFGCGNISVRLEDGKVTGGVGCGDKVRHLQLTGDITR